MKEVDVRGFSCPIPVVRTKKVMDETPDETIKVLVESSVSKENVSRLAQSRKYVVQVDEVEDGFELLLTPAGK